MLKSNSIELGTAVARHLKRACMFYCIVLREEPQHGVLGERWVIFSTIQWEFLMEQIAIIMQSMGSNYVATIFLLSSSMKASCCGSFYTLSDSIKEHSSTMEKVFHSETCSFFLLLRLSNVYTSWRNIRVRTSQWNEGLPVQKRQSRRRKLWRLKIKQKLVTMACWKRGEANVLAVGTVSQN